MWLSRGFYYIVYWGYIRAIFVLYGGYIGIIPALYHKQPYNEHLHILQMRESRSLTTDPDWAPALR